MATWRYLTRDVRTGALLAELPLSDVTFSQILNGAGAFTATLALEVPAADSSTTTRSLAPELTAATVPERTAVYLERNDVLVGAAIIWGRTRGSGQPMGLTGAEHWSFFRRQLLRATKTYSAADQTAIARDLVDWVATQPGGNIAVTTGGGTSGVVLTVEFPAYERRVVAEIVEALAAASPGFDFSIDVTSSGLDQPPTHAFRTWWPRRGRIAAATGLSFVAGKNLIRYNVVEDGTQSARSVDAIGSGDGRDMLISTATRTDLIDAGYPITSSAVAFKDVTNSGRLASLAIGEAAARAVTPEFWTVEVDPDDPDFPLGSWIVGDECSVVIDDDDNFPQQPDGTAGFSRIFRIVQQSISAPGGGRRDTVTLVLGAA